MVSRQNAGKATNCASSASSRFLTGTERREHVSRPLRSEETKGRKMPDYSRIKLFAMPKEILLDLFTTGQTLRGEVINGFPRGSQIIRQSFQHATGIYYLTVQHDSFEPVKDGDAIPVSMIQVRQELPAEVRDVDGEPAVFVHGVEVTAWRGEFKPESFKNAAQRLADKINCAYRGVSEPDDLPTAAGGAVEEAVSHPAERKF